MLPARALRGVVAGSLLVVVALTSTAWGQSTESNFYRAYYLEHARRDFAAAAKAYDEVLADRRAATELKAEARVRRAACHEELASADFTKLMPPNALVYAEINRPGGQLTRLLEMVGLLGEDGSLKSGPKQRLAISPALIRELLGIRGAAVAITGFDMAHQAPTGVGVLHPGDIEVIRGLVETALPAAAEPVESVEGFPTYLVEGQVFVTLTKRLVIVSCQRHEIAGVVGRLKGEEGDSLADSPELAEAMQQRDESLLFFCVNFKPVLPLLNAAMAAAGTQQRELAIAQALLDLKSLRSLVGRAGVSSDGLYFDVTLRLDEFHRNLAFHFFRMPPINQETLRRVPSGAAGFLVAALNEAEAGRSEAAPATAEMPPITMLDIGREFFANIVSVAVFAVPTDGKMVAGQPIPPVAAVITVNDPAKSQALWNELLGVASLASGAGTLEGMRVEIEGVEARRYVFPDGISVYLAMDGHDVVISPSKAAISRSLATLRRGESILDDPAFASSLERVGPDTTLAVFAHPGRCAELARQFMEPDEVREMQPVVELLTETVASVVMEHSNDMFRFSTMVTGLPDVGPLVSKMIAEHHRHAGLDRRFSQAQSRGDWDEALGVVRGLRAEQPEDRSLVWKEFKILAVGKEDCKAARALGEKLCEALRDDALRLNSYAWALLTEDGFGGHYSELALKMSKRSNELTNHQNWRFVDTLALALFETGDVEGAVDMERKALELCGGDPGRDEAEAALERFEAALKERDVHEAPPS